jgi:hypothetical protein
MKHALTTGLFAACLLSAACSEHSGNHLQGAHVLHGAIQLGDGQITLHASDAPIATIGANGDLQIGQQSIATDQATRDLLKTYYANAQSIHVDSVATGQAGEAMGNQIADSVKAQLANGHPEQFQKDVEASTKSLEQAAMKICQDVGNVKVTQDQLAGRLAAFKPYASIVGDADLSNCHSEIHIR